METEIVIVMVLKGNVPERYHVFTKENVKDAEKLFSDTCEELMKEADESFTDVDEQVALDNGYWEVEDKTVAITWSVNNLTIVPEEKYQKERRRGDGLEMQIKGIARNIVGQFPELRKEFKP